MGKNSNMKWEKLLETEGYIGEKARQEVVKGFDDNVIALVKEHHGLREGFSKRAIKLQRVSSNIRAIAHGVGREAADRNRDENAYKDEREFSRWFMKTCAEYEGHLSMRDKMNIEKRNSFTKNEMLQFDKMPDLYLMTALLIRENKGFETEAVRKVVDPAGKYPLIYIEKLVDEVSNMRFSKRMDVDNYMKSQILEYM